MAKSRSRFMSSFSIFGGFALLLGLGVAVFGLQQQQDQRSNAAEPPVEKFVEHPQRGLYWAGLKSGKGDSLCGKLLEVTDKAGNVTGCTHGPDPAPVGLDATKSVEPLSIGEEGTLTTAATIPCDGDGSSGYRIQGLYVRASDRPDRYAQFAGSFQQYAQVADNIFSESAAQTGGVRHVRFVTDTTCQPIINQVVISPTGDDTFGNMVTELKNLGYNRADRKYMVWADATIYCGIGTIYLDDSPGQTNWNNTGPLFGRTDSGCWGGMAEAHELMHNLGGVQNSAPHASGGMHCIDEYDRMCYDDDGTGPVTMTIACGSSSDDGRFDCNKDDYFNTNPPLGSYLTTHWNTANNRFLIGAIFVTPTSTPTPTPTPTLAPSITASPTPKPISNDTIAPTVSITSPSNASIIGNRVTISASAQDNVSVVTMQVFIDGTLRTSSSTGYISTNWNSRKASKGTHTIKVTAKDVAGNMGSATISVYK